MAEQDHIIQNSKSSTIRVEHMVTLMDSEDEVFLIEIRSNW